MRSRQAGDPRGSETEPEFGLAGRDQSFDQFQRFRYRIRPVPSHPSTTEMVGLDAHGDSGLRFDVDHHYKRLFGFAALTSAFSAAFDLSQRNTQSALTYPSVTNTATASVGRDMSETGAQITRRNL